MDSEQKRAQGRKFTDGLAVREPVPLFVGLVGPSGSGKTKSALRLADGIKRVVGGEIWVIDTEGKRATHYAEEHQFRHVAMAPPFSSYDYMAAVEHCVRNGASIVIIDSMSHEHEGPGGLLEWHAAECERLSKQWKTTQDKVKMSAWQKPKSARRAFLNRLLQLDVHVIFCFRAKRKLKIVPGRKPVPLGWQPIAGDEFIYEMTANALLLPGSDGQPTWHPEEKGEREMVKFPGFARQMFSKQLDEQTGEKLARWAAGTAASQPAGQPKERRAALRTSSAAEVVEQYDAVESRETFDAMEGTRKAMWPSLAAEDKKLLKNASDRAKRRVNKAAE